MKKNYINPAIREICEETEEMIAASELGFGADVDTAAGADARDANIWDED